ncbi:MAG: GntR family transcriptional regulator/MocR family aminotransferase [Alteromonadaceae bacterium]|jgi:GntR family transcriptional regulator/MocR family aminotransferase
MADGAFERQLRKLTRTYEQRRDHMVSLLSDYQHKGLELSYAVPDGGMAMWVKTPFDASALAQQVRQKGVFIQTENEFHLLKDNSENRFIRLGFAGMNEGDIEQGLDLLFGDSFGSS